MQLFLDIVVCTVQKIIFKKKFKAKMSSYDDYVSATAGKT